MATISFFVGFDVKDKDKALKVLGALKEKGVLINLAPEEETLFRRQEEAGKASLDKLGDLLDEL
ncbi:hypothetical protein [Thermovibrio sp.]